ncbi:MAG: hypothetical protein ACE5IR_13620 [bacterium]
MKDNKTIISFSSYSKRTKNSCLNREFAGRIDDKDLSSKGQLFLVVRGPRSHSDTDAAIQLAANIINEIYYADLSTNINQSLRHSFEDANALIFEMFNLDPQKSKLVLSCAGLVLTQDRAYFAHSGSNQAYLIRDSVIEQLSVENLTEKTSRTDAADRPADSEPSHGIGLDSVFEIEMKTTQLESGDYFLLTNYGLQEVTESEIRMLCHSHTPERICQKVLQLAQHSGYQDNIDVHAIRVESKRTNLIRKAAIRMKEVSPRVAGAGALIFVLVLFGVWMVQSDDKAAHSFLNARKEITGLMMPAEPEDKEMLMSAQTFLSAGEFNVALSLFRKILYENPDHLSAREGVDKILKIYMDRADSLFQNEFYEEALSVYTQAAELQPDDAYIKIRIVQSQDKLALRSKPEEISKPQPKLESERLSSKTVLTSQLAAREKMDFSSHDASVHDWDFRGLTPGDFALLPGRILFKESPSRKKALYLRDLDRKIKVRARIVDGHSGGRFGVIIGYKTMNVSPFETYYLFTVFRGQQYLLQKYSNFKKELVFRSDALGDSTLLLDDVLLEVSCLQDRTTFSANGTKLFEFIGEETTGKVGFYADPQIRVEFSEINVSGGKR